MLMQSEGENSANTITIHNNTWFQCPQELPHSSATSQLPALSHIINLMLGVGRVGRLGQGVGSAKAVLVTWRDYSRVGRARHKIGVGGGGGGIFKEGWGWSSCQSQCAGPAHSSPHSPQSCLPPPSPSPETLLHGSYTNGHITK